MTSSSASGAPIARRVPTTRLHHGDEFVDQYEWLRDKEDPEVVAHLEAENAFTEASLDHLATLRETIFDEIKSRVQETDLSVPTRQGSWWYYSRSEEGKQYGISCRVAALSHDDWTPPVIEPGAAQEGEQILLDSNAQAEGHEFFSLGSFDVSTDGTLLVYATDTVGDERYELRVRDLITGEDLDDVIPGTLPGALITPDGRYVFYTTPDEAWRPDTVWRHEIGTPVSDDVAVFTEPDERYWVGVGLTRSQRYLVIEVGSKITSESRIVSADDPTGEFELVWPRREGVEYDISHTIDDGEDRLLILHNDGALNFELVSVSVADPQGERRVVLPASDEVRLESVDTFSSFTAVSYRREGMTRLATLAADGLKEIDFDEPLFTAGLGGNPEWTQPTLRLHFGSFVTPATVFDYVVAQDHLTVLKRQAVLGGYDPTDYDQRRVWATAPDGARIPISMVAREGQLDRPSTQGPPPVLLYGYGSYEASIDPSFSAARLSLLDRGVVFAIAHVRGGGELGRAWYDDGKLLNKKNTFTDFLAAADELIEQGYASPDRLVAEGRSAGGLLMGAIANIGPDRFAGILAGVPFVDPLTSILDPSLPLTVIEWDEWGDPLHNADVYEYMKSYSPYENVTDQEYPRILAVTSINDTRVLYVEPAKWTARLREVGAPVLLKTEMSAGHGGVSGRYSAWRERAFELAWILDVLGAA
ncbi:S9 family peptidase [Amnibacterium flavum]|uniref:Oligopeptidase B n=1 Tax=Amnibacterium flavum TaxID=2173173 RepID=A0A2V1HLU9_9MICO|nr:S9 family peptidase [Amnibacterium flavum]PVZ93616.1 oligopeptidase B [Amnibacterium flavum]